MTALRETIGTAQSQRHYGMDWLRIAAFTLLIVYHVAMVFAPWTWVIKTNHSYPALIPPMALLTPWRLPLLFAVSGYSSRKLFDRSGGALPFARSRASRLLIPLAFGMAVIVPVEMWVRVLETGYPHGYLRFWAVDYWRIGSFYGREFPSWEHLWFVAYLATYSLLLAAAIGWQGTRVIELLDRAANWLVHGPRLLWVPIAGLVILRLGLLFVAPEHQGLVSDWGGHSQYVPIFLFGFALAGAPPLWSAIARLWKAALAVAIITGTLVVGIEVAYPGTSIPPHALMALDRAAKVAMAWSMILTLFHVAETWWNRDHPWRKPLAEAVFPFYIVHHPAIVLLAWYTLPFDLGPALEFALLLGGTMAICFGMWIIGGRVGLLRPLIGLGPLARSPQPAQKIAALPGVP
ncbi:acyltransferase family protein [Sphingomonas psychrotolerans]|uniref:Acyltransferase family protein n=1 Tax=Sphingomonas psychrotolerans TaxID=1327635 RepID=A0ABU3N7Q8_9SPHN|nr:acyltransferase family protein [Sphingomonas psychrotolerans]MDT8759909.1 acyltransferase family protein [Sphingomonas psychrotolerans]